MKRLSALIADEDMAALRFVRANLRASGYDVISAVSGQEALSHFECAKPDIMLSELDFADMSGIELCQKIRGNSDIPYIVMSKQDDPRYAVDILNAGADDYLRKPFAIEELLARINAIIRRSRKEIEQFSAGRMKVGNLVIDLAQRQVGGNGFSARLTPTEFQLLVCLANNADKVVPHEELLSAVWGDEYQNCTHYLRVNIGRLRHKMEAELGNDDYIVTCSGVGYMLRSIKG